MHLGAVVWLCLLFIGNVAADCGIHDLDASQYFSLPVWEELSLPFEVDSLANSQSTSRDEICSGSYKANNSYPVQCVGNSTTNENWDETTEVDEYTTAYLYVNNVNENIELRYKNDQSQWAVVDTEAGSCLVDWTNVDMDITSLLGANLVGTYGEREFVDLTAVDDAYALTADDCQNPFDDHIEVYSNRRVLTVGSCSFGYEGADCSEKTLCNVNNGGNACQNGGAITGFIADNNCACQCVTNADGKALYDGSECQNPIACATADIVCQSGTVDTNTFLKDGCKCNCTDGYSGDDCSSKDSCLTNKDGNTCVNGVPRHFIADGNCDDEENVCVCDFGYKGDLCDTQEQCTNCDMCAPQCENNGIVATGLVLDGCKCDCSSTDYEGALCDTPKQCTTNKAGDACLNGGSATGLVKDDDCACNCQEGYEGDACEIKTKCASGEGKELNCGTNGNATGFLVDSECACECECGYIFDASESPQCVAVTQCCVSTANNYEAYAVCDNPACEGDSHAVPGSCETCTEGYVKNTDDICVVKCTDNNRVDVGTADCGACNNDMDNDDICDEVDQCSSVTCQCYGDACTESHLQCFDLGATYQCRDANNTKDCGGNGFTGATCSVCAAGYGWNGLSGSNAECLACNASLLEYNTQTTHDAKCQEHSCPESQGVVADTTAFNTSKSDNNICEACEYGKTSNAGDGSCAQVDCPTGQHWRLGADFPTDLAYTDDSNTSFWCANRQDPVFAAALDITVEAHKTDAYTDATPTCTDFTDSGNGNIASADDMAVSVSSTGTVNRASTGTYSIIYTCTDAAGASVTASRTVTVQDTTDPSLALSGGDTTVTQGGAFTAPTATCSDSADGSPTISSNEITVLSNAEGKVTAITGIHTITYTCEDASGNTVTKTHSVTVECATDFSPNSDGICVETPTCEQDTCNGRGECSVVDNAIQCDCEDNYGGDRCQTAAVCEPGYSLNTTSNQCQLTCQDDTRIGFNKTLECGSCKSGYSDVDGICTNFCQDELRVGYNTAVDCGDCKNDMDNDGTCDEDDECSTITCQCYGDGCSTSSAETHLKCFDLGATYQCRDSANTTDCGGNGFTGATCSVCAAGYGWNGLSGSNAECLACNASLLEYNTQTSHDAQCQEHSCAAGKGFTTDSDAFDATTSNDEYCTTCKHGTTSPNNDAVCAQVDCPTGQHWRLGADFPTDLAYTDDSNTSFWCANRQDPVFAAALDITVEAHKTETYTDTAPTCSDYTDLKNGNVASTADIAVSVTSTGTVNRAVVGEYTLDYKCTDAAGAFVTASRTVTVKDTVSPNFVVNAGSSSTYEVKDDGNGDSTFVADASACSDANGFDASYSYNISNDLSSLDDLKTAKAGTYTITHKCTDDNDNQETRIQSVTVSCEKDMDGDGTCDFKDTCASITCAHSSIFTCFDTGSNPTNYQCKINSADAAVCSDTGFTGQLCNECAAGSGWNQKSDNSIKCEACVFPETSHQTGATDICTAQKCAAGYGVVTSGGDNKGNYTDLDHGTNCEVCPYGKTSPEGDGNCAEVVCPSGYQRKEEKDWVNYTLYDSSNSAHVIATWCTDVVNCGNDDECANGAACTEVIGLTWQGFGYTCVTGTRGFSGYLNDECDDPKEQYTPTSGFPLHTICVPKCDSGAWKHTGNKVAEHVCRARAGDNGKPSTGAVGNIKTKYNAVATKANRKERKEKLREYVQDLRSAAEEELKTAAKPYEALQDYALELAGEDIPKTATKNKFNNLPSGSKLKMTVGFEGDSNIVVAVQPRKQKTDVRDVQRVVLATPTSSAVLGILDENDNVKETVKFTGKGVDSGYDIYCHDGANFATTAITKIEDEDVECPIARGEPVKRTFDVHSLEETTTACMDPNAENYFATATYHNQTMCCELVGCTKEQLSDAYTQFTVGSGCDAAIGSHTDDDASNCQTLQCEDYVTQIEDYYYGEGVCSAH